MGNRWWLPALLAVATSAAACAPVVDESTSSGTQNCRKDSLSTLYPGIFTVGTAVAGNLGYTSDEVRWVRVPFNGALEPGPKTFDANLSQFSITHDGHLTGRAGAKHR